MYAICDVDYWEYDATLVIEGDDTRYYFRFGPKSTHPTLDDAIEFFKLDTWKESKNALRSLQRVGLYSNDVK